jgi:hypothetical protein
VAAWDEVTIRRSIGIGSTLAVGVLLSVTARGAVAAGACSRYAATPARVFHGDDSEVVHSAASAMYCPDDVDVKITACVQADGASGWADVGCVTSPGTRVTPSTRGGRGEALSFDVPCVSGRLRTHVTGGEGLEPTEWDSPAATIECRGSPPVHTTAPGGAPDGLVIGLKTTIVTASPSGVVSFPLEPLPARATGVLSVRVRRHAAAGTTTVRLGRATFTVRAGRPVVVRVPLNRRGRALLQGSRRVKVRARITVRDAAGHVATALFRVVIRASGRPRAGR